MKVIFSINKFFKLLITTLLVGKRNVDTETVNN